MKNLISILSFLFWSLSFGQNIKDLKKEFWTLLSEEKFETIYENQDKILDEIDSENSKEKTAILICLQYVNHQMLDFKKALNLEESIYNEINQFFGYFSKEMQDHLSRLSHIYSDISDIKSGKIIEFKNLEVSLKVFGYNSFEYSQALLNYVVTITDLGYYGEALTLNEKGIDIAKNIKNEKLLLQGLINQARIFCDIESPEKAKTSYLEALEIIQKSNNDCNQDYQIILSNLVAVSLKLFDFTSAIEYSNSVMLLRKELYGSISQKYALSCIQSGMIFYMNSDYSEAITNYLSAKKALDKLNLQSTDAYFTLLNNLSICYLESNKIKEAEDVISEAILLSDKYYETLNPFSMKFHSNFARTHLKQNHKSKYVKSMVDAIEYGNDFFINRRFGLTFEEQLDLKFNLEYNYYSIFQDLNLLNQKELLFIYSNWINFYGIINSDEKSNFFSQVPEYKTQIENLNILKKRLNQSIESNDSIEKIRNLEKEIDYVERDITILMSKRSKKVLIPEISKNLHENSVFIEFISLPNYDIAQLNMTDSTRYLVFITDYKDSLLEYIYLENGTEIDEKILYSYKEQVTDFANKTDLNSPIFFNYFWKPIADKIGDAKTIYVSLGGVYNNINLNTIYNPETGKYLLEEKDIRIVNSARDFVLNKENEKKNYTSNTASLFGFPDFNGNTTFAIDSTDFLASTRDLNSFWVDSLTRGGLKATPLPATKIEVENISLTLKSKGWQVNSYLAENASETNIKKQQSQRVLHLATHGYFFQDIPMEKDNNRFLGMDRQQVAQDPMLRSGLLLTGANKTLKGEATNGENGLLSAAEASLLDLRETELVVLSACETGKGEVNNSEGVYGLRKAFSDAGAQNIIMSLWKVDDKVTQEFMSRFYEIWLNDKTTIREAFHRTQLEIKAKYPQPYYWGAFILVGV